MRVGRWNRLVLREFTPFLVVIGGGKLSIGDGDFEC